MYDAHSAQTTADLTGLRGSASYTYLAYSDSACATEIAHVSFDTLQGPTPAGVSNLTQGGTRSGSTKCLS